MVDSTDDKWREKLSPQEFFVCRQKGTEAPFTGEYWDEKRAGQYFCRCCEALLFDAQTKYDSGSGWPSFWAPVQNESIAEKKDQSHGMIRTEILCEKCAAHLGHVFSDGPTPTGLRYCVNSASLTFQPSEE